MERNWSPENGVSIEKWIWRELWRSTKLDLWCGASTNSMAFISMRLLHQWLDSPHSWFLLQSESRVAGTYKVLILCWRTRIAPLTRISMLCRLRAIRVQLQPMCYDYTGLCMAPSKWCRVGGSFSQIFCPRLAVGIVSTTSPHMFWTTVKIFLWCEYTLMMGKFAHQVFR